MIKIHQIFVSGKENIPESYKSDMESVQVALKKYPDYLSYEFWDYDRIWKEFKDDPVLKDFDYLLAHNKSNKTYVMIGDYFRWAICFKYGGLYLDTDINLQHTTDIKYLSRYNIFMPYETKADGSIIAVAHLLYMDKNYVSDYHKEQILQLMRAKLHSVGVQKGNPNIDEDINKLYSNRYVLINVISVYFIDQVIRKYLEDNQYKVRIENPRFLVHNFKGSWL